MSLITPTNSQLASQQSDGLRQLSGGRIIGDITAQDNSQVHVGNDVKIFYESEPYVPLVADFRRIHDSFQDSLDEQMRQDLQEFQSLQQFYTSMENLQRLRAKKMELRSLGRIGPFIERLASYAEHMRFLPGMSNIIPSLWGVPQYLIQLVNDMDEAYDAILDTLQEVGSLLPELPSTDSPFLPMILPLLYQDVLAIYSGLLHLFKLRGWQIFFSTAWKDYEPMVALGCRHIKAHTNQTHTRFTPVEMESTLSGSKKEFFSLLEEIQHATEAGFISWNTQVNARSYDSEYLTLRNGLTPNTGEWLLRDQAYTSWLRSQSITTSILWLCGIPGAGKSHLAAKVVESFRKKENSVLYIFLDHEKSDSITWISVMHSLMLQMLHQEKDLQQSFLSAWKYSGKDMSSSQEGNEELMIKILSCIGQSYVVLDGLDEVALNARREILEGFIGLVTRCDAMKLLCCSREELDIANIIRAKSLIIRVEVKNNRDIATFFEHFVQSWMDERADIEKPQKDIIRARLQELPAKAAGMFLYAKLMLEYLRTQSTIADVTKQLARLPDGIEEIYDRIFDRAARGNGTGKTILMWIATSKARLRVEEILLALSIRLDQANLDPEYKPLGDIRFHCGPIVEIKGDYVRLAHFSVREYMFDPRSGLNGPWLDQTYAESTILSTMLHYLSIHETRPIEDETDIVSRIERGELVLLTLTLQIWVEILKSVAPKMRNDGSRNRLVQQLAILLQVRHCSPPDLSTEPERPPKHASDELHKEMTEKRRIFGLIKEVVKRPKTVPQFAAFLSQDSAMYKQLCQIAMASVSGLEAGKHWHPLNLQATWARFQETLERMICPADWHLSECVLQGQCNEQCSTSCHEVHETRCQKLERLYGINKFKCSRLDCPYSRIGFGSRMIRQRHMDMHDAKYKCPLPECRWRTPFGSQKQLETHTSIFHLGAKTSTNGQSVASSALDGIDSESIQGMMLDSIENSNAEILELGLNKTNTASLLNALMVYSYLSNTDVTLLNVLVRHGAQKEHLETIQMLGPNFLLDGYPYIQQAVRDKCEEVGLHLQRPVSALTLAVAGSSTAIVDWLICQGFSVSEQRTNLFHSRPLDYLFALQLARTRTPQQRKPLPLDLVKLLLDVDAPVNPGQAMSDLCSTPFIKAHDEAYCRAAEMMVEKGAKFREDGAWTIERTSKSARLVELAQNHGSEPLAEQNSKQSPARVGIRHYRRE